MSKIFFPVLLILSFNTASLFAAPAYGTDIPRKGRITMGYQANLVFKHMLSGDHGRIRSYQHYLDLSYGVFDWFAFDGKLGVGDVEQRGGELRDIDYGTSFAGGYGFRILLLDKETDKTRVTFGFHHISVHPTDENINSDKFEIFLDDWQFDLLGSKKFGKFEPFVGAKASKFDLGFRENKGDRKRYGPKYYGGFIAGCGFDLRDNMKLKIEAHAIDEESLSAGIYYSY